MLHAKIQDHRTSGSGEEDFLRFLPYIGHGGYLGHVTWTIYINSPSPFPRKLHIKFSFDWQSVSEEKMFENCGRRRRTPEHGYTISSPMS